MTFKIDQEIYILVENQRDYMNETMIIVEKAKILGRAKRNNTERYLLMREPVFKTDYHAVFLDAPHIYETKEEAWKACDKANGIENVPFRKPPRIGFEMDTRSPEVTYG